MTEWPARPSAHTPDKTGRPDEPWWTREAITWMDAHLGKNMSVLEWGCGASTVWMAKRCICVVSIEHDPKWAEFVNKAISDLPGSVECAPVGYVYVHHWVTDALHDVIVVDGRLRVSCCAHAANILKRGGYLLLDNAERPEYAEVHELLAGWPVVRTDNGLWRTDIWTKPE